MQKNVLVVHENVHQVQLSIAHKRLYVIPPGAPNVHRHKVPSCRGRGLSTVVDGHGKRTWQLGTLCLCRLLLGSLNLDMYENVTAA